MHWTQPTTTYVAEEDDPRTLFEFEKRFSWEEASGGSGINY
jgi:hypothetical protein